MSRMPELGNASENRTRKVSQSMEEDAVDADARKKAQSIHARHLRAHCQSCYPGCLVVKRFKQYEAEVCEGVKLQQYYSM